MPKLNKDQAIALTALLQETQLIEEMRRSLYQKWCGADDWTSIRFELKAINALEAELARIGS